jgi:uncharacterized repeat protein (TIGR01451 family)
VIRQCVQAATQKITFHIISPDFFQGFGAETGTAVQLLCGKNCRARHSLFFMLIAIHPMRRYFRPERDIDGIGSRRQPGRMSFISAIMLFLVFMGAGGVASAACSQYQGNTSWGGVTGGTGAAGSGNTTGYISTINEYYFGNAANFVELAITNLTGDGSSPAPSSIWSNWAVSISAKSGNRIDTIDASLNQASVTACYEGQTTYLWIPATAFTGAPRTLPTSSQTVLWDSTAKTNAIDMLSWQNPGTLPLTDHISTGCANLTSTANAGTTVGQPYQTQFAPSSLGNKDMVRVPNLTGNWVVSGDSNGPAASGTTPVVSGTPVTGVIGACNTSPNNGGISIVKSMAPAPTPPVLAGSVVPFSITVKNQTATAQSVTVTDSLPAGMTYFPGSATPAPASVGPPLTWTTAPLAAGTAATINFSATINSNVPDGSTLINQASVPLPSSTLIETSSVGVANVVNPITIAKGVTCSAAPCVAGSTLTFTVTVTNRQNPAPTSITVNDVLPSQLVWTVTPSHGSYNAGTADWTITGLAAAPLNGITTATLTAVATVTNSVGGQTLANTATIKAVAPTQPNLAVDTSASASISIPVSVSGFDAVEVTAAKSTNIRTKLAGTSFSLDILVLDTSGNINTGYTGTVSVQLVDSSAGCPTAVLQTLASYTFTGSGAGRDNGRRTMTFTSSNAVANARIRITDSALSVTSCSFDNFSIRPSAVTLNTTASAPPPASNATPAVKAGAVFTITAATLPTSYAGALTVDTSRFTAQTPTQAATTESGGTIGSFTLSSLVTNASPAPANNARYGEVGYLYAAAGAFRNDAFTSVDRNQPVGCDPASTCDCISSTVGDNNLSDTLVGSTGRYGCSIGNKTTVSFGRFIPDHFSVATVNFAAGCSSGGFSYMDQSFALSAVIEARNAMPANAKTNNYSGAYANGTVSVQMENANDGIPISTTRLSGLGTSSWSAGSFTFIATQFARLATADGPFDALAIGVRVADDASNSLVNRNMDAGNTSCTADALNASNGTCTAVTLVTTKMRYGRLKITNSYGSELLALPVPVTAQYWNGNAYATNTDDSCTTTAGNLVLTPASGGTINTTITNTGVLSDGAGKITLTKPTGFTAKGSVNVSAGTGISSFLPGTGRATFGLHKSGPIIYRRELY